MKKQRIVICAIVLLALAGILAAIIVPRVFAPRAAITYYVDNQATTEGNGSLENPWDNIAGHVDDLAPGDTMCVRGDPSAPGRVYTEAEIHPTVSGTSGNLITVKPYTGEHVIIQTTGTRVLRLESVNYWLFEGFAFDRQSSWDVDPVTRVVWIKLANHNIIRDCKVYNGATGIHITSGDHNLIDNCQIYDNGTGMFLNGGTENKVTDCDMWDNRGDAIHVYNGPNALIDAVIENNHIWTTLGKCSENAVDVKQGNVTIRGNVMHGFRYCDASCGGSGGGIGAAVVIHRDADGVLLENNEIYGCASGVELSAANTTVCNNLIRDLVIDTNTWANIGIYITWDNHTRIFNNTLADCPDYAVRFSTAGVLDLNLYNNLFYNTNKAPNDAGSEVTPDYNGWFNAADRIEGTHDTIGTDPQFVSPSDYHLTENSPARGAGKNNADLGAFAYESTGAETSTPPSGEWWEGCPPDPPTRTPWAVQPTYTPNPTPTCRLTATLAPNPSPTPYPTHTPYPTQPYLVATATPDPTETPTSTPITPTPTPTPTSDSPLSTPTIVSPLPTPTTPPVATWYSIARVPVADIAAVREVCGGHVIDLFFRPYHDAAHIRAQLDIAHEHGYQATVNIYDTNNASRRPWEWNGSEWVFPQFTIDVLRDIANHPALFAIYALHEGFEIYTANQQRALYTQLKEIINVPIWSDVNGLAIWENRGHDLTDGICDYCGTFHHRFRGDWTSEQCIEETLGWIDADLDTQQRLMPNSVIVFQIQTFSYYGYSYPLRLPTVAELMAVRDHLCALSQPFGYYPWHHSYPDNLEDAPQLWPVVAAGCSGTPQPTPTPGPTATSGSTSTSTPVPTTTPTPTASPTPEPSAGILADHNAAKAFANLTDDQIDAAENLHVFYGRTSHGTQLVTGAAGLGVGSLDIYQVSSDLGSSGWDSVTRNYLDSHPGTDVVMWSWCGQVSSASSSKISAYLDKMSALEAQYPSVAFVYMTGHLDGTGPTGNLHQRNDQIRAYTTDKALYDFADIESYDPDGNYYPNADDNCAWCTNWCAAHPGDCASGMPSSCAHSHKFNCKRKGQALWWMLAWLSATPTQGNGYDIGAYEQ